MSTLTPFITPSAGSQQLARSRFRLLASKLTTANLDGLRDDDARLFARAWICVIEDTSSVRHLSDAWRTKLTELAKKNAGQEFIKGSLAAEILHELESQLPDADYVSVWIHLENSRRYLVRLDRFRKILGEREMIAQRIIQKVETIYGKGDRMEAELDFVSLRQGVVSFIQEWGQAEDSGPGATELLALQSFHHHIIAGHEASADAWQLLLQSFNTEQQLLGTGIEDLIEVLTEALPRFTTLREFARKASRQTPALPSNLQALAVVHMLLTAAPQSRLAAQATGLLQNEKIAATVKQETTAIAATPKGLREGLRLKLEQYQIDWWDSALAWFHQIVESEAALAEHAAAMKTQAAEAFSNTEDPRRLAGLAIELIQLTTRLGNVTIDMGVTAPVVRSILVQDYGCDPQAAAWSQGKALSEGSIQILQSLGNQRPLLPARTQLRKLADTITQIGQYSLSSSRAAAGKAWTPAKPLRPETNLRARCQRDMGLMLQRVALEHRIARPATAQNAVLGWYVREVAVHLKHLPSEDFTDHWLDLISHTTAPPTAELLEAAHRLHRALPRLTTALKLIHHHDELGMETARQVMSRLPDYHKAAGKNATDLCARDNSLTMLQAGRILLSGTENPAEDLAVWWNAVVAAYIVNRPTQLFEVNLQALHATLLANLSPVEVDTIFPVLHQVYKESLGIQDLPLLFFRELRDIDTIPNRIQISNAHQALPSTTDLPRWAKGLGAMAEPSTKSLPEEISSFVQKINEVFSMPTTNDEAWTNLRTHQQDWIKQRGASVVIRCLAAIASEGSRRNSSEGRDLTAFALQGIQFVAQDELATQLESGWAATAGPRVASSAATGGGDDIAQSKCARDLQLMTDYLVRQLRTQSLATGALNTLRFLIECVVPYVGYPVETWREIFQDWKRSHTPRTNDISRPLFDALADLLLKTAENFPALRQICGLSFTAGSTIFSTEISIEKTMRHVFSTTLIHHAAPAQGLLNRKVLSNAGFTRGISEATEAESIFNDVVLHLDRQFDHLDGEVYYKLQEAIPVAREAQLDALGSPATREVQADLATALVDTNLSLGLFQKLGRMVSGPKSEEMAAELWRAIVAAGITAETHGFSASQVHLLVQWLKGVSPTGMELVHDSLTSDFTGSTNLDRLPDAVLAFLGRSNASA